MLIIKNLNLNQSFIIFFIINKNLKISLYYTILSLVLAIDMQIETYLKFFFNIKKITKC